MKALSLYILNQLNLLPNRYAQPGQGLPGRHYANSNIVTHLGGMPSDGETCYITLVETGRHNKLSGTLGGFRSSSSHNSSGLFLVTGGSGTATNNGVSVAALQTQTDGSELVELRYQDKTYIAIKIDKPQYQEYNDLFFRGDATDLSVIQLLRESQVTNISAYSGNGLGLTLLGGSYRGNGEYLVNLNANHITTGVIDHERLPAANANHQGALSAALFTKLTNVATGATKNATDAQLRDRRTHTGEQPISTITNLQSELDNRPLNNDSRLSNARDWTAGTVSEAEAIAGASNTARKWTARRVHQAAEGWWQASAMKTKLDGIEAGAQVNLPVGTTSGTIAAGDDPRFNNSRDWDASIVSVNEAKAGTANTARKWTASRVHSAADGWWEKSEMKRKLDTIQEGAGKVIPANLSLNTNATRILINNSNGSGVELKAATGNDAGLLTAALFTKLNGIQAGAQVNPSTTASRSDGSTSTVLQAKAMNDHRQSGDHDNRYLRLIGGELTDKLTISNSDYKKHLELRRGSHFIEINPSTGNNSGVTNELRFEGSLKAFWFDGLVSAADGFSGDGNKLTNLNAANLAEGTIPAARISSTASRTNTSTATLLQAKGMRDHVQSGDHDNRYSRLNTTDQTTGYLYLHRNHASASTLYVNQSGDGDIARFYKGANATALNGTGVTFKNNGNIAPDGNLEYVDTSFGNSYQRGTMFTRNNAITGGIGGTGNQNGLQTLFMGLGATPWTNGNGIRVSSSGVAVTGTLSGNGSGLTNLNASNLASGTVARDRLPVATTSANGVMTGAMLTKLNAIQAGAQVNVPTNLGNSTNTTSVTITSSTGGNTTIADATTSRAGAMTAAMVTKLNGIQAGAQVNASTTASRTSSSTTVVLQAKAMNDHRGSGDHDGRYLRLAGGTMTGVLRTSGAGRIVAACNQSNNDYGHAPIEILGRDANLKPILGFHNPGRWAGTIRMDSATEFHFYRQGASQYATVRCEFVQTRTGVNVFSDSRIKDVHGNIRGALEKTLGLNGVYYSLTENNAENERVQVGYVADEVQRILPEVVTEIQHGDYDDLKTIDYAKISPLHTEAIKEMYTLFSVKILGLQKEIEQLKAQLA